MRDLEFEGDTLLKELSGMCKHNNKIFSKDLAELSTASTLRWRAIDKKIGNAWDSPQHSRLADFTDICGKRVVLVANSKFDSHESASYDLMMGQNREREEKERKKRILQKELSDLMKRNSEALSSYDEILALEVDNDDEQKEEYDTKEDDGLVSDPEMIKPTDPEALPFEQTVSDMTEEVSLPEELDNGGDDWARTFIWQDGESIVAR